MADAPGHCKKCPSRPVGAECTQQWEFGAWSESREARGAGSERSGCGCLVCGAPAAADYNCGPERPADGGIRSCPAAAAEARGAGEARKRLEHRLVLASRNVFCGRQRGVRLPEIVHQKVQSRSTVLSARLMTFKFIWLRSCASSIRAGR
jgi:hypothetical protein